MNFNAPPRGEPTLQPALAPKPPKADHAAVKIVIQHFPIRALPAPVIHFDTVSRDHQPGAILSVCAMDIGVFRDGIDCLVDLRPLRSQHHLRKSNRNMRDFHAQFLGVCVLTQIQLNDIRHAEMMFEISPPSVRRLSPTPDARRHFDQIGNSMGMLGGGTTRTGEHAGQRQQFRQRYDF